VVCVWYNLNAFALFGLNSFDCFSKCRAPRLSYTALMPELLPVQSSVCRFGFVFVDFYCLHARFDIVSSHGLVLVHFRTPNLRFVLIWCISVRFPSR